MFDYYKMGVLGTAAHRAMLKKGGMVMYVYDDILPNRVSFSILLHWMAKERSELSKIVMRSSSAGREERTASESGHIPILFSTIS